MGQGPCPWGEGRYGFLALPLFLRLSLCYRSWKFRRSIRQRMSKEHLEGLLEGFSEASSVRHSEFVTLNSCVQHEETVRQ